MEIRKLFHIAVSRLKSHKDPDASVSEVVYNWVAAGNMEREAVYSQAAAC